MVTITILTRVAHPGAVALEGITIGPDGQATLNDEATFVDTSMPEFLVPTQDTSNLGFEGIWEHCRAREDSGQPVRYMTTDLNDDRIAPSFIIAFQGTIYHQGALDSGVYNIITTRRNVARASLMQHVADQMDPLYAWAESQAPDKPRAIRDQDHQRDVMLQQGLEKIERELVALGNLMVHTYLTNFPAIDQATSRAYTLQGSTQTAQVAFVQPVVV